MLSEISQTLSEYFIQKEIPGEGPHSAEIDGHPAQPGVHCDDIDK